MLLADSANSEPFMDWLSDVLTEREAEPEAETETERERQRWRCREREAETERHILRGNGGDRGNGRDRGSDKERARDVEAEVETQRRSWATAKIEVETEAKQMSQVCLLRLAFSCGYQRIRSRRVRVHLSSFTACVAAGSS